MTSTSPRSAGSDAQSSEGPGRSTSLRSRHTRQGGPASYAERYVHRSTAVLRVCVGLIFCWFGILKFFPHASPAEDFAVQASTEMTGGFIPASLCLLLLAVLETAVGAALVTGRLLRCALAAFFLHMAGVFLSLLLLPALTWHVYGAVPTLEGQYVLKNIVLVAACLHIAADELTP
ncbi:DoxX family membrane protein [Streptomyces altiplanensis]